MNRILEAQLKEILLLWDFDLVDEIKCPLPFEWHMLLQFFQNHPRFSL